MSKTTKRRLTALCGCTLLLTIAVSLILLRNSTASPDAELSEDVKPDAKAAKVPVEVADVQTGSISATLSSSSTIEAEQSAQVLAKAEGIVTTVQVREGDRVRLGQILATLEDEERKLSLEKASLRLGKAEAEYERAKRSFEQKLISHYDYEKAAFDRDLASSELETAKLELDYTQVRAPFAGRITEASVVAGRAVRKGDHLFALADFDSLVARIYLPEKDIFNIKRDQPASLVLEAKTDAVFEGRIRDISPVVDPKTGTIKVTVDVTSRSPMLRPGAFVQAQIVTDTHVNAALVPKIALLREDNQDFVYLVIDGLAVKRPVRCGYASDGRVEVIEGIARGDRVIVAGHTALKDRSPVEVLD